MTTQNSGAKESYGDIVQRLLDEAKQQDTHERRADIRYPFFRPATLTVDGVEYATFTREISRSGIGLLHSRLLSKGTVLLTIPRNGEVSDAIPTEILWCRPCGDEWYLCGGRFVGQA